MNQKQIILDEPIDDNHDNWSEGEPLYLVVYIINAPFWHKSNKGIEEIR